jgi:RNA 2',3'-cyclic 3'-phosphodiesterase
MHGLTSLRGSLYDKPAGEPSGVKMGNDTDQQRVFFALWPEDPLRAPLARLARDLQANGRPVPPEHLHLTLAFPGTVAASVVRDLVCRAGQLEVPAIRLTLDRLGHFPRPRVAWIGPSETPPELSVLASALAGICRDAGIRMEQRAFRPHVTLRRFVTRLEAVPVGPLEWVADGMVLIESGRGGRPGPYRILHRWPVSEPGASC